MPKSILKTFYLVSTPIGNLKDISFRALEVLQSVPVIIVEEYKVGKKILDLLKVDLSDRIILELNEHIEDTKKLYSKKLYSKKLLQKKFINERYYRSKQKSNNKNFEQLINEILAYPEVAMISDAGTPVIADPGTILLKKLIHKEVIIKHIGGASSVLSALVVSGFDLSSFYYAGFLPNNEPQRSEAIEKLFKIKEVIVIMEVPYRLEVILTVLKKVGDAYNKSNIPITIAFNLTHPSETIFRGTINSACRVFSKTVKNRSPFVIIINNR